MKNSINNETKPKNKGNAKSSPAQGKRQRAQSGDEKSNSRRATPPQERLEPRRKPVKAQENKRRRSAKGTAAALHRNVDETEKPIKRKKLPAASQAEEKIKSKGKRKSSGSKDLKKADEQNRRDYGDEFYTDELEMKRRRSRQRRQPDEDLPQLNLDKRPMSHRSRKLKNIGIASAMVTVILAIGIILSLTVFFRSEEFTVEGAEYYSAQDIIDASGMSLGENLFLSDKKTGEENIERELPYIDQADISIKIPNTIVINVTESEPAFLVQNGSEYVVLSADGKVLEIISGSADNYDVPLVLGCSINSAQPGQQVEFQESGFLSIMKNVSESLAENEFTGIKEIDLSDTASVSLNYSNRIKIIIGLPEDVSYKLKTAKIIITENLSESDRGQLDVSGCREGNKASYFKPISDLYLDRITDDQITQATQSAEPEATEPTTQAETQSPNETVSSADEYTDGVPRYTYPTDADGNIVSSSDGSDYDYSDDYSDDYSYDSYDGGDYSSDNGDYSYDDYDYSDDYSYE